MKLKFNYHDVGWRYWVISLVMIALGLAGWPAGFNFLILLSVIQVFHFIFIEKSLTAFPVQVRIAFLILAVMFFPKPLNFLYWWPLLGLTARVTLDYCLLARMLSLLPWNRKEPFSWELARRRIFSPPTDGSICP